MLTDQLHVFSHKTDVFPSKTTPDNLDPSYKMDLDFWNCFDRENPILQQNYSNLVMRIWGHFRGWKPLSHTQMTILVVQGARQYRSKTGLQGTKVRELLHLLPLTIMIIFVKKRSLNLLPNKTTIAGRLCHRSSC